MLRIGLADLPGTADPAFAVTPSDWLAVGLVNAGLYRLDDAGTAIPDMLAEPCRREAGGRRWQCRLRRGVFAHDGRRVVSADVRASFARLAGSPHAWVLQRVVVAPRDETSFTLTVPSPLEPLELGLMLASPALSIVRGPAASPAGPFRVTSWSSRDGSAMLAAHDQFHGGRPYLDALSLRAFGTPERAVEAFHYGTVDLVLEDSRRYKDPQRISGPVRETLGLLVSPRHLGQPVLGRRALFRAAPRGDLATRTSGQAAAARDVLPGGAGLEGAAAASGLRWFVGYPEALRAFCEAMAAGFGPPGRPWPIEPADATAYGHTLRRLGASRWDAALVDHLHVDVWPEAAARTLATLAGIDGGASPVNVLRERLPWVPLVDRGRTAVVSRAFRGVRWTGASVLDLSGAFRP